MQEIKKEYQNKKDLKPIGYWCISNCLQIELLNIIYNINDYAVIRAAKKIHVLKIYYNVNSSYINMYGMHLNFNDCMRCN